MIPAETFAPGPSMVYARSEFTATVLRWRRAGCGRCGKGQLRATQHRAVCPLKVTSSSCICARLQRKRRLASRSCGDIVGVSADACECRTAQVSRAINSYQLLVVSGSAWVSCRPGYYHTLRGQRKEQGALRASRGVVDQRCSIAPPSHFVPAWQLALDGVRHPATHLKMSAWQATAERWEASNGR